MIVPGKAKAVTPTNLNDYHNSHGHGHEKFLTFTGEQQGVELPDGPLMSYLGCSMSEGQVKPAKKRMGNRPQLPLAGDREGIGEDESIQGASSRGGGGEKTSST